MTPSFDRAMRILAAAGHDTDAILAAWNAPHRRYHTVDAHLAPMLDDAFDIAARFDIGDDDLTSLIEMVAYHDIVYTVGAPTGANEAESAIAYSTGRTRRHGGSEPGSGRRRADVADAIRGTTDHRHPRSFLAACLFDLDLAGLGRNYVDNGELVAAESGADPSDPAWVQGRTRWCESMLARPSIFHTAWGARYEHAARAALTVDLWQLRGRRWV